MLERVHSAMTEGGFVQCGRVPQPQGHGMNEKDGERSGQTPPRGRDGGPMRPPSHPFAPLRRGGPERRDERPAEAEQRR